MKKLIFPTDLFTIWKAVFFIGFGRICFYFSPGETQFLDISGNFKGCGGTHILMKEIRVDIVNHGGSSSTNCTTFFSNIHDSFGR